MDFHPIVMSRIISGTHWENDFNWGTTVNFDSKIRFLWSDIKVTGTSYFGLCQHDISGEASRLFLQFGTNYLLDLDDELIWIWRFCKNFWPLFNTLSQGQTGRCHFISCKLTSWWSYINEWLFFKFSYVRVNRIFCGVLLVKQTRQINDRLTIVKLQKPELLMKICFSISIIQ